MDKFWGGVVIVLLATVGLLLQSTALTNDHAEIQITDLETECVEQKTTQNNYRVNYDNTITFQGQYPVQSPKSQLEIDYTHNRDHITLNVITNREVPPTTTYERDCDAYAVYNVETVEMEGRKTIEIQNNGNSVKKETVNIR